MKIYNINTLKNLIDNNINKIKEIKITSVKDVDFKKKVGNIYRE